MQRDCPAGGFPEFSQVPRRTATQVLIQTCKKKKKRIKKKSRKEEKERTATHHVHFWINVPQLSDFSEHHWREVLEDPTTLVSRTEKFVSPFLPVFSLLPLFFLLSPLFFCPLPSPPPSHFTTYLTNLKSTCSSKSLALSSFSTECVASPTYQKGQLREEAEEMRRGREGERTEKTRGRVIGERETEKGTSLSMTLVMNSREGGRRREYKILADAHITVPVTQNDLSPWLCERNERRIREGKERRRNDRWKSYHWKTLSA